MVPPAEKKTILESDSSNIGCSNMMQQLAPIEESMMHLNLDPYFKDFKDRQFSYTTISDLSGVGVGDKDSLLLPTPIPPPPLTHHADTMSTIDTLNTQGVSHHMMGGCTNGPPPINHASLSGVVRLLADFGEKSRNSEWPMSTSVYCHWCCHPFQGVPIGLPIKMTMDEQQYCVTGCYCSLECACAYNFASRESVDERLSRYSLLNGLAVRIGCGAQTPIRPAPDRLALNIFGGHLSINEFRVYASSSDRYIIANTSPMISVTQQLEELNEQDTHSEYRYVPLDSERVCRFQEKIKLKRNKPLLNTKNTLDQSMKLKITKNN
jgi:hypothetical protein